MNYYWEKDEVLGKLDIKMTAAFQAVSELARKQNSVHARRRLRHRHQPRGPGVQGPRLGVKNRGQGLVLIFTRAP